MTPREKASLIDKYNESFLEVSINALERQYRKWFDKVTIESTKRGKGKKEIKKVIREMPLNERNFVNQSYNALVLSGITNIIEKQRLDQDDREALNPIFAIVAAYGLRNHKVIARKVQRVNEAIIDGVTKGLDAKDRAVVGEVRRYYKKNDKTLQQLIRDNKKSVKNIHKNIKSNISKVIIKTLDKEIKERVLDDKTGAKRPKTAGEIRDSLRDKFGKQVNYRVNRILDTELGTMQEETKFVQHKTLGYTHKKWNSQQDSKVRTSHQLTNGQIVPIDKKFTLAGVPNSKNGKDKARPAKADFPRDAKLPPEQRIQCRCNATYTKR